MRVGISGGLSASIDGPPEDDPSCAVYRDLRPSVTKWSFNPEPDLSNTTGVRDAISSIYLPRLPNANSPPSILVHRTTPATVAPLPA